MTSATLNPAAALPNPTQFFQRAINALVNFGVDMLERVQKVPQLGTADHLPKRWRHPKRAEQRLTRTLDWIFALARTLSGGGLYLRAVRTPAAKPRPSRPARAKPAPATPLTEADLEEQRAVGRLRYMRMVFATQPTNRIAKRLARRLGVNQRTDWWPEELLTITETPAAWAARVHRPAPESPLVHPAPEPPPPDPPTQADPAPVAFHRRE